MVQDRSKKAISILESYNQKIQENGGLRELIGVSTDPHTHEEIGYSMRMDKTSREIQELEALGFKVIFPAELTEEAVARMDTAQKYVYDAKLNNALVVDTKGNHSLDLASVISRHYFQEGHSMGGLDAKGNSLTEYPHGEFKEGMNQEYQKLLEEIGYETSMDEYGRVTAFSDIPYPAVKRTKFEQFYENAKGKIKGMFSAIKNRLNSKNQDQVKENETDERE